MFENYRNDYSVIYADPPWYFKSYSKKGEGKNATQHYPCMEFSDIVNLPVSQLAAQNSVLLMWVTEPFLRKSFEVIDAWDFTYKTVGFTWVKTNSKSPGIFKGTGYWTRSNPEQCLLCTKGKPKRKSRNVDEVIISPRREHSRKPDEMYGKIMELLDGPYIELFSRTSYPGWDVWGKDVGKFDTEKK